MIKFEELTLGEIEELELMLNTGFDDAFKDGKPKGRALRVLYFIFKRRENPEFKFEETEKLSQKEAIGFLTADAKKE
jgi:hypothetical protein